MSKDRERYRYIDVGLERGSWTLEMFEEDARRHHMSDHPGKLIALRLTEYYERREEVKIPSPHVSVLAENGHSAHLPNDAPEKNQNITQAQGNEVLEISRHTTENADVAAEYWATLEEQNK
jgi:hypothetical protein